MPKVKNKALDPLDEYEEISHHLEEHSDTKHISIISTKIDNFVRVSNEAISWVSLLLILSILIQVISRYVFDVNFIILEELQWHLYAIGVMFGLSYAMVNYSHVRVDIFRNNFSRRTQQKIEIIGIVFLMLPFIYIVIDYGIDLTYEAYRIGERSDSAEGLPLRWLIKAVIPLSFSMLFLATVSRLISYTKSLLGDTNGN